MTAERYRDLLARQWPLVVFCAAVAVAGALMGSLFIKPVYRASASVILDIPPTSSGVVVTADRYVQGGVQLAMSNTILATVAARYPGLSAATLKSEIAASPILNTHTFEIDVTDADGQRAASLANDIAAAVIVQHQQDQAQDDALAELPVRNDIANTQRAIAQTQQQLAALAADAATQRAMLQADLANLQQDMANYQATLANVQQAEAVSAIIMHVAQPASAALQPQRPQAPAFVGAALLVGLLLGLGLIAARDHADQQIRGDDIAGLLGYPVLATIDVHAPAAGLAALQKSLAFWDAATPLHSLAFTASSGGDAATGMVAAELARTLAKSGKHPLLIDANLRQPAIGPRFGLGRRDGFSNAILACAREPQTSLDAYIHHADELAVMPAGTLPPNPVELTRSHATAVLLKVLAATDTDPLIFAAAAATTPEAQLLAASANGAILVVDLAHTRRDALLRTNAALADAQAHVLGVVVLVQKEAPHA